MYKRILIILSCLILSSTVLAQTTSEELFRKWKSVYEAQRQNKDNRKRSSNTPMKRKNKTVESVEQAAPPDLITINDLLEYNVVAISYELLSNAQRQCGKLRKLGYRAQIYLDSRDYYRVIVGSFNSEQKALDLRASILESYPDSWILHVINGREERFIQKQKQDVEYLYDVVDEMPCFPGGQTALFQYLSGVIAYPAIAENQGIQGRVIVTFVVERDGSIADVEVVKSVHFLLDAEAIRVVSSMPRWCPGKIGGKPVRVKYTLPVTFRLQ